MLFFLILILLTTLQNISGLKCVCESNYGSSCDKTCDAGSYCKTTWVVANGGVQEQGCVTTRSDLSTRMCQMNRKGIVTCLCNTEKCNDASFSIPSDASLSAPPVIKCYSGEEVSEDNFCFGQACTFTRYLVLNDFGDVLPSAEPVSRGCDDSEYNDDINSMNMCRQIDNRIDCLCNTEFCNQNQPFQVPLGNVLCYLVQVTNEKIPYSLKYCLGHACYIFKADYTDSRGCVSVSDGAPEELKKSGESEWFKFCTEHLCNGISSWKGLQALRLENE